MCVYVRKYISNYPLINKLKQRLYRTHSVIKAVLLSWLYGSPFYLIIIVMN